MTVVPIQVALTEFAWRSLWPWARILGGAAILAVLFWRLGSGPFIDGVHTVNAESLAAGAGIGALTTACCAWRWSLVAGGLGVEIQLRPAVAACYRSQFLNTVLPGGVLGDVHRGVSHGRDVDDVGGALRAVAWERTAGQVVQAGVAVAVLLALPSPVRSFMPVVATIAGVGALGAILLSRRLPDDGATRGGRMLRVAIADIREGLMAPKVWPRIVVASVVVVAGHAATFLIAARAAGSTESLLQILPLALLALLAMGVPMSVGGWGPREGVTAWAFAAAGLSADQGVATAVVYGVMVLVASLPGGIVLLVTWLHRHTRRPERADPVRCRVLATVAASARAAARG